MSSDQQYVSKYLTHFVGRKEPNDEERYSLLKKIVKMGWLVAGAMADTVTENLPAKIQQVSYSYPHRLAGVDLNATFTADVVCFTDIPQLDLGLHMRKYSHFGLSFAKEFLLSKGANPVFYISTRSIDRGEGGVTFETLFRKELQNLIDMSNEFHAGFQEARGKLSPRESAQFKMHNFMLKYFLSFLKFWDYTDNDDLESNFYMEREWRIFGGFQFGIQEIQKIVLPERFAKLFREDFPQYANELVFPDVAQ
jgi:hypothetical protein